MIEPQLPRVRKQAYPDLLDHLKEPPLSSNDLLSHSGVVHVCLFEHFQWTNRGHYFLIVSMTHLALSLPLCSLILIHVCLLCTSPGPLYGSLMRAWQCFFTSTERLSELHSSISQSLVTDEGQRVKTWQKKTFPRKIFCGFKESYDNNTSFSRAQKPWSKKLTKLESARVAYHKCCQKEQAAMDKEKQANENSEMSPEKKQKIMEARERATEEKEKTRERYEKMLEDVSSYTPRYMEEMEAIFEQSQEEEKKRISFLREVFLSIHSHLDITNNESVKAVYSELHDTLMAINDQDDLKWWKNNHGPGMPTDWPKIQEWLPPVKKLNRKKRDQKRKESRPVMIGGVKVRALYDYVGEETDELSFKSGEVFLKVEEEDDQGWCRGVLSTGKEGFYPANYVEVAE
uniref:Zgc:91999 n=1 Tax=Cynoglossus semilaevis TaxID=244447 RepID=A0A3P8W1B8_CYNSE